MGIAENGKAAELLLQAASPIARGLVAVNSFFQSQGSIVVEQGNVHTYYEAPGSSIGAGVIHLAAQDVQSYAQTLTRYAGRSVTQEEATKAILLHEIGHYANRMIDAKTEPGPQASLSEKVDWCISREARAAVFEFGVVSDLRQLGITLEVAGTSYYPDIYSAIVKGLTGASVDTAQGLSKAFGIAKDAYYHDPQYLNLCTNWYLTHSTHSQSPSPLNPSPPPSTGSNGAGASGGAGHIPAIPGTTTPLTPGGHWQPVPQPHPDTNPHLDQFAPSSNVEVVGIPTWHPDLLAM